jgi:hypothetical protein
VLEAVINEFQLQSKIRFIVSDNATAKKRAKHILLGASQSNEQESIDKYFDDSSLWQYNDGNNIEQVASLCAQRLPQ